MNDKEKEELKRWCHTVLLGGCLGWEDFSNFDDEGVCKKCGSIIELHKPTPDYCSSLDLASIVEAKAIEVKGWYPYRDHLARLTWLAYPNDDISSSQKWATASAETRCKAAKATI